VSSIVLGTTLNFLQRVLLMTYNCSGKHPHDRATAPEPFAIHCARRRTGDDGCGCADDFGSVLDKR
jgi:hypothetical protein